MIGGGTLGRRIAMMLSAGGSKVHLFSRSAHSREAAKRFVDEHASSVREQLGLAAKIAGHGRALRRAGARRGHSVAIVESVPEDLALKKQVFRDSIASPSPTRSWRRTPCRIPVVACSTPFSPQSGS